MPISRVIPPPNNIRIAYDNEATLHTLVRRCQASELGGDYTGIDYEILNDFFRAKDVRALALAVGKLPPLYGGKGGVEAHLRSPESLTNSLASPVEERLLGECYFDPTARAGDAPWSFTETARVARSAVHDVAANYALPSTKDDAFFDGDCLYETEPLHDWLLLRNLLSIAMRIYATAAGKTEDGLDDLLLEVGFSPVSPTSRAARSNMGADGYVIPVAYNPFFSRPAIDMRWDDKVVWPLLSSLVETDESAWERFAGFSHPRHLKGFPDVRLLTSVQADQARASLALKKAVVSAADKWMYLALISESGETQKSVADRFLRALDAVFGSSLISCGGEQGAENLIISHPDNLPSALWAIVKDHPGRFLLRCRRCDKTIFATTSGGPTRFCSTSCRTAFNKGY